jgi:hypothetical protein
MKMLGVAADVYRGLANDSKYGREKVESTNTPAPQQKASSTAPAQSNTVTNQQLGKLVSLSREYGLTNEDMAMLIKRKFGLDSSKQLTKAQAGMLIGNLLGIWEELAAKGEIAATSADDKILLESIGGK